MIENYGADAVRWFILSDSPPDKDIQWSDNGVVSSNKFLQKIWDLNYSISLRKEPKINELEEKKFVSTTNSFIKKINNSIEDFRFNVSIASFYEVYKHFSTNLKNNLSNKVLKEYIIRINKLMIPFTPHLAYECLELLNCKNTDDWPQIEVDTIEEINLAVQINGKTRDIIKINKDTIEEKVNEMVLVKSKAKKYLENKKIIKTIFVSNKIINYII